MSTIPMKFSTIDAVHSRFPPLVIGFYATYFVNLGRLVKAKVIKRYGEYFMIKASLDLLFYT
jgi:hypothetical protein